MRLIPIKLCLVITYHVPVHVAETSNYFSATHYV